MLLAGDTKGDVLLVCTSKHTLRVLMLPLTLLDETYVVSCMQHWT